MRLSGFGVFTPIHEQVGDHRAPLEAGRREALLDCIRELLQNRFGGRITKRYMTQLLIARRS